MEKEKLMFELKPEFQRELFQRVINKYKGSIKASKFLEVPPTSIRGYKNLYSNSVPSLLLEKIICLGISSKKEINKHTNLKFYNNEKVVENLNKGREEIKKKFAQIRKEIPSIKQIKELDQLDFLKWLHKYKHLSNPALRKLVIESTQHYSKVIYFNFVKSGFRKFSVKIPNKFVIDNDFLYFFGLWCGDRAGRGRFGVCNKNKEILFFVENFLKNNLQNIEKILYIKEGTLLPDVEYDKKYIIKEGGSGWALSIHANNGILSSFFQYLLFNLEEFLSMIENKNVFFAGLFDAEGNVSLYNRSFRWACKDSNLVALYSKFLKSIGLFTRYDGSCLVSYDLEGFYDKILFLLKNKDKINHSLFLCRGKGEPPKEYRDILVYLNKNNNKSQKQIAKDLKRSKVYSELKKLNDLGFVSHKSYPFKFMITSKGMKLLEELKL